MLAERLGLLEHADVQLDAAGLAELRQLDRARQPGGTGADDEHVELHPVARPGGPVLQDQALLRERGLVVGGEDRASHGAF